MADRDEVDDAEPRYSVADTDYYGLTSTIEHTYVGVVAVLDEEAGGYIAFCTSEEDAARIVAALMAVPA